MSLLANLVSDPKSWVARMKVGAPEPAELRKAVVKLEETGGGREVSAEDVGLLQQRIVEHAANDELHLLARRDIRQGCKVVLHAPSPLAEDERVLAGLLSEVERSKRRAAFFAVIDAYLDGFEEGNRTILALATKLEEMTSRWPWRPADHWPEKIATCSLLEPVKAPAVLARRVLEGGKPPRDALRDAGLDTPGRRFGGLVEAAFRVACHMVMGMKGQDAVSGQRTLIEWARDDAGQFGYKKIWPQFVEASLTPWEIVEPSDHHKRALLEMLEQFGGGDPRANPGRWRTVMDNAPGAYAVLLRWLTRASVLQFLDVVDRLMPDYEAKRMWAYRRAFWMSYLQGDGSAPAIDAAWVAFGYDGARLADQFARNSGDRSFSAYGRQHDRSSQHAALILQIGDLVIVDWSHSAKYQVWRRGDRGAPKLFERSYREGDLYSAPIQETHSSPSTYSWQKRLAQTIERKPFFSPKPAWRPKNA